MKSLIALLVLLTAACSGAVRVAPPTPHGTAAQVCAKLEPALPRVLDGASRTASEPPSPYVAVWGPGEITLRCGVDRPAAMAPTDTVSDINGVAWFPDPAKPALFTAIGREAYIEVTISAAHHPGNVLTKLADPIKETVP